MTLHRPIPLLPYEKQLAAALGVSEAAYQQFKAETAARSRIEPSTVVAGPAALPFVINLVIGVGFSLIAALFRPRQAKPPTINERQTGGANRSENRRYAPRYGFGSTQEVANSGQRYPLVVARRETLDGFTYGGVRVNLLLLWSQMWSYRGSQLFRGVYALGRRNMGSVDVEGFAFGDNSLNNYGIGLNNSNSSRFTLYYSANGGRIKGADNIAGRSAARDIANAENFGGADVFRYTGLNGGVDADFCCVAKPSANTVFGLYGICPNGLAYRVMPRLRPTANYQIYARNNGQDYYLEGEDDTAALVDFWEAKYSWSCRSGLTKYIRAGNTTVPATGENYEVVSVGVDDILVYRLDSKSDASTKIEFNGTNSDIAGSASNTQRRMTTVGSGVAAWQHSADDNLIEGELYKIGSALAVLEERNPVDGDRWFNSRADNEPPGNGYSMEYRFRVIRNGLAGFVGGQIIEPSTTGDNLLPPQYDRSTDMASLGTNLDRYKTVCTFPQIFRCALATFGVTRSTRLIEIGFKSTIGIKAQSVTDFRTCPKLKDVNAKAGENRIGPVSSGTKLNPSRFTSNTKSETHVRYSGFKLLFREGAGPWTVFADAIFLFRSATGEALYNYLRVQFSYHSPDWQVQLEPLSSWEIASDAGWGGAVIVIDPIQASGSRQNPTQGVRVSFNGYHLTNFDAEFAIKALDATQDIGYGWTTGGTMLDEYPRLAEKFVYDEIQTTAESGPEHEVSYVNIFTTNTEQADYDDLACLGLNIFAGTEATQLAQASQSVTNGYEMRRLLNANSVGSTHMWPDVLWELMTSKELGDGAFISDAQLDLESFRFCAQICYDRRYFFDAVIPEPVNLLSWAADVGGTHLLKLVKRGSKFGLAPMVVFGVPLQISGLFTAGNIMDGSFELELIPYEDRQPTSVIVKYREQSPAVSGYQPGLFPVEKTIFVKEAARPDTDPVEELDLSDYCTSPRHAIDASCLAIRMRRLVDHTIRFSTTPEGLTASLASGDYIQVAYDLIYFDSYAHGVVTNGGQLVTTRPDLMTTGTHACLTWDGSDQEPIEQNVVVSANGTATPTGIFFARKNTGTQLRTYEITKINIDQAGVIAVEAMVSPTDSNGISLLTKDWTTYASDPELDPEILMPTPFPPYRPTDRRLVPGVVPQTVARAVNGRTVRRPFASHQGGMELELTYANITDTQAEAIRQAHRAAYGRYGDVTLPSEVWAGDPELEVFAAFLPAGTAWRFAGEIKMDWAKRGRVTATVRFINTSRTVFALPPPPEIEQPPVVGITVCTQFSEIAPTPTGQPYSCAVYSSDGQSVYLAAKVPAVPATRYHASLSKFDLQGNLLWAAEDASRDIHPYGNPSGVVTLPNGDAVACYYFGFTNHKLYRYNSGGNLLASRSFEGQNVPGAIRPSARMIYVASLDKIAVSFDGPGVFLYDPLTLAPVERIRSTRRVNEGGMVYVPNVGRFVSIGRDTNDYALFEFSSDLSTNNQKYLYLTGAVPLVLQYDSFAADSFGAIYCLAIQEGGTVNSGVFILKLSASAAGYTPLKVAFLPYTDDTVASSVADAERRIDVKPDGTVLVFHGGGTGTTTYRYIIWEINTDLTAATGRTVVDLAIPSGADEISIADANDTVYSPDWTSLVVSHNCMSPLQIPVNIPLNNEISFVTAVHGTVRVYRQPLNRAITDRTDLLPARNVNAYSTILPTNTEVSQPPTMVDLTARFTWDALGRCRTFGPVTGFAVSETTTLGAAMATGANNWLWQRSLTTAAGSIYFAGIAQMSGQGYTQGRWFVIKYDSDLNMLWAKWLEGPYEVDTFPAQSQPNGAALTEGPADGVFVVTKGRSGRSIDSLGASLRVYLLNSSGNLVNTAAYQLGAFSFGYQVDMPCTALYVPSQDRLYIAGESHMRVVMRGLTLDQPYSADAGGISESGGQRIFWLPDKQRVVFAGTMDGQPYASGSHVTEYSPDLLTRYQYYGYDVFRANDIAMDQFGAVYFVSIPNPVAQNPEVRLTKLASSDAGYTPVWSRKFPVTPVPGGGVTLIDCAVEVLPDGRIVVSTSTPENSPRSMRASFYTITPDGLKITACTRLNWTGLYPFTTYSDFIDPVRETATFITYPFTIGKTSLRLPLLGVDMPLGSTAAGNNANKNMTGNTDFTEVLLTDDVVPSRTVITAPSRTINPMIPWPEAAWSTTDLSGTVTHVARFTGPLWALVP